MAGCTGPRLSTRHATLKLGDVTVEVQQKDIKHLHLSVYPPAGKVRISAPLRMKLDTVRVYAISKLAWIRQQQRKLRAQERESPREYVDRESHYVWGRRCLLNVVAVEAAPAVKLRHTRLTLQVRPGASREHKQAVVAQWYRDQIKAAVPALLSTWEPRLRVKAEHAFVQKMRTKWGSCNPSARNIRLNTDLAKKPAECLEYVLVHELVHLLEPTHSARFVALMDRHLPDWAHRRKALNALPVRHEDWGY